jgi:uncharacterized protein
MKIFVVTLSLLFILLSPIILHSACGYVEPWGKDNTLSKNIAKKESSIPSSSSNVLTKAANYVIAFRQHVLTKIDGPRSHFRPTSSRYMQLAIHRYGFFKGYIMGCDRLLRENNDKWIYRNITINNVTYNYDPAITDKFSL